MPKSDEEPDGTQSPSKKKKRTWQDCMGHRNTVFGPSLGFAFPSLNLLVLGDYHTAEERLRPGTPQTVLDLVRRLSESRPIDVFVEDARPLPHWSTDMMRIYANQRRKNCSRDVCAPPDFAEAPPNGSGEQRSTLAGVNEYLFMCGRVDEMCPVMGSKVHRVDIRPDLLIRKPDGSLHRVTDDRHFVAAEPREVQGFLGRLVDDPIDAAGLAAASGLSANVLAPVCSNLSAWRREHATQYEAFSAWWKEEALAVYDPRTNDPRLVSSPDYYEMWVRLPDRRRSLLFTIYTNALMDAMCISSMVLAGVGQSKRPAVLYVGCAHAEVVSLYFRLHAECVEAAQNCGRLRDGVQKFVEFPDGAIDAFVRAR